METPPKPAVFWKHILFAEETPLTPAGWLGNQPAASLSKAIEAVAARRKVKESRDAVFLVIRSGTAAEAQWWIYEFVEDRILDVAIGDIAIHDLPLAADPDAPQTYLIDAFGAVGKLVIENAQFAIRKMAIRADAGSAAAILQLEEPAVARAVVDGFVVPREMSNHAQNIRWTPKYAFKPGASLATLANGLAWMSANLPKDINIRAVGSRHSWSPIARCDGVTVLPGGWTGISQLNAAGVAPNITDPDSLFRVLAGVRIRELNSGLQRFGRAIPYLGGFDGQTIGGVLPTGTHGSVLAHGPLADLIRSIDLVCFDGQILRIEPAREPVTNVNILPPLIANEKVKITLRLDDDLFDAVRVGLGAFGVIHSLVIKTVPKFWLKEVRTVALFSDISNRLAGENISNVFETKETVLAKAENPALPVVAAPGGLGFDGHPKRAFHFELLWNPYTGKTLITTRHWVDEPIRKELEKREPRFFDNPPIRNIFRILGLDPMPDEFSRPDAVEILTEHAGPASIGLVEQIAKDNPGAMIKLIDTAIDGLADRKGYIQRSYNVFNIGKAANLLPSLSATISVPLKNDLWLRAAELMASVVNEKLRSGLVLTAPTSLRFVRESNAWMADPADVCKFEIIFGGNSKFLQTTSNELVGAIYHALCGALGIDHIRFHWGQLIPNGTLDVAGINNKRPVPAAFPNYIKWRKLRDELDPDHRGMTPWLESILPK
ncbi:MAG: FAD-binding protein [Planctomycetota bacterium]